MNAEREPGAGNLSEPTLMSSVYWKHKEKFLLYKDTYEEWVLFAVEEGTFHYRIGEHSGTAGFGDLVLCPPGTPFRRVIVTPLTFHFFRVAWEGGEGQDAARNGAIPTGKISIRNTMRLASSYQLFRRAEALQPGVKQRMQNHYFRDIWYLYAAENEHFLPDTGLPETGDPLMQKAASLILRQAFLPLHLGELAKSLNLSPSQFSKRFKKSYDMTPLQYLTRIRLDKAKSLLLETKLTLEQISECCGYPNGFYLNRVFSKQIHSTPSQYRKAHQV